MHSVVLGCVLSYTHISLLETMTEAAKRFTGTRKIIGNNKFEEKKGNLESIQKINFLYSVNG